MKLVFVVCTTLTVLQILDVSIAANPPVRNATPGTKSPPNNGKPVGQTPKPANQTPKPASQTPKPAGQTPKPAGPTPKPAGPTPKPAGPTPKPAGLTSKPATQTPKPASVVPRTTARGLEEKRKKPTSKDEVDNNESPEVELPVADVAQSKQIFKNAVKRQASKTGSGFFNNLTRLINSSAHVFGFITKLARSQSSNAINLLEHTSDAISRTGDGTARGIIKTIKSARTIGSEGEKQFSRTLSNAEKLGLSLFKLGGTIASTSLSVGNNVAKLGNAALLLPHKSINRVMNSIVPKLSSNEDETDDEKSEESS